MTLPLPPLHWLLPCSLHTVWSYLAACPTSWGVGAAAIPRPPGSTPSGWSSYGDAAGVGCRGLVRPPWVDGAGRSVDVLVVGSLDDEAVHRTRPPPPSPRTVDRSALFRIGLGL